VCVSEWVRVSVCAGFSGLTVFFWRSAKANASAENRRFVSAPSAN